MITNNTLIENGTQCMLDEVTKLYYEAARRYVIDMTNYKYSLKAYHDTYKTNLANWTCTCGAQEMNAYHICKHIIQAVSVPYPDQFFTQII